MTKNKIIDLAVESGFWQEHTNLWMCTSEAIQKFFQMIQAAEREACAERGVDAVAFNGGTVQMEAHVRQAIRARGTTKNE